MSDPSAQHTAELKRWPAFREHFGCSKNSDGTQTTRDQGAGTKTRVGTPAMYLEGAKEWAHGQIEAAGAVFGAIYFSANGSSLSGTGELESPYNGNLGWYK